MQSSRCASAAAWVQPGCWKSSIDRSEDSYNRRSADVYARVSLRADLVRQPRKQTVRGRTESRGKSPGSFVKPEADATGRGTFDHASRYRMCRASRRMKYR